MIDNTLIFCENQAVTVDAASGDVIDTVGGNVGASGKLELVVACTESFDAVGAATLQLALQDSADGVTFADVFLSKPIPKASLVATPQDSPDNADSPGGMLWRQALPKLPHLRRYLRAYFTVATGPMTAGKATVYLDVTE